METQPVSLFLFCPECFEAKQEKGGVYFDLLPRTALRLPLFSGRPCRDSGWDSKVSLPVCDKRLAGDLLLNYRQIPEQKSAGKAKEPN